MGGWLALLLLLELLELLLELLFEVVFLFLVGCFGLGRDRAQSEHQVPQFLMLSKDALQPNPRSNQYLTANRW